MMPTIYRGMPNCTDIRTSKRFRLSTVVVLLTAMMTATARADSPTPVSWIRQFGTSSRDEGHGVSADRLGNVYTAGSTQGDLLDGTTNDRNGFIAKHDALGNPLWSRQFHSSGFNTSTSADGLGNVYVSGFPESDATAMGAFVAKYDDLGTHLWTRQVGGSSGSSYGVSADGLGSVYMSGTTSGDLGGPNAGMVDAFVSKFDSAGNLQWIRQLGTPVRGNHPVVSADSFGNVFLSGSSTLGGLTGPTLGAQTAFIAKYDALGAKLWTRELGSGHTTFCEDVSSDGSGNAYIAGYTNGQLGQAYFGGPLDAYLAKYDAAGNFVWTRQLGTSSQDYAYSVSADVEGDVYVSGRTFGDLGGPFAGGENGDAYVAKYDSAGNHLWTRQFGTSNTDVSLGVSADKFDTVYIAGLTSGVLGASSLGDFDAFLIKLAPVPEPNTLWLATFSIASLFSRSRKSAYRKRGPG